MYIALKYVIFAAIATAANIVSQDLTCQVYEGAHALYVSIGVGTLIGLVIKYVLDKKYIFSFTTRNTFENGSKFVLYTGMGVFTTIIFWGTELGFDYLFTSRSGRYLGAVIGLAIGYWTKYNLDKRFVFVHRTRSDVDGKRMNTQSNFQSEG